MRCSVLFHLPKAPPPSSPSLLCKSQFHLPHLSLCSEQKPTHNSKPNKAQADFCRPNMLSSLNSKIPSIAIQAGAILSTMVVPPVYAVTGVNDEDDLIWVLIQSAIAAFFYFLVAPPIIMNWLRIRWYRRKLLEMYVQFMFVFLFFPGLLLWAPFLNFRKFPRDPDMEYPWSKPKNPENIKNTYLKYPWATPEDYD